MDKNKKLNLKKELLSLKYCYKGQIYQIKKLLRKVRGLGVLFKLTKQFIKEKDSNNFLSLKGEKEYLLLSQKSKEIFRNLINQSKTLHKSILFNKYNELREQKAFLQQIIQEKNNIIDSMKIELNKKRFNDNKISYNYYLNSIYNIKNNHSDDFIINNKFNNIICNYKNELQQKIKENLSQFKNEYTYFLNLYQRNMEIKGYTSYFVNKKSNKVFSFTLQPLKQETINSSNDSIDDSISKTTVNNDDTLSMDIIISKSKSLNSSDDDKVVDINIKHYISKAPRKAKKKIQETKFFRNDLKKNISKVNIIKKSNLYVQNDFSIQPIIKKKKNLQDNYNYTEVDFERNGELGEKLLKIKEHYYKCLDERYELKSSIKSKISEIYKIKEKIKRIKKEQNFKKSCNK